MGIITNTTNIDNIVYNGTAIEKVIYNGTIVWTKAPKVWDFSKYAKFVGLYGTAHFLFRADTSNVVHMVNISTFEEDGQFLFDYRGNNEFMAYGNGVYCCNQYGDDYLTDSMNAWIVRYHNGTAILLNNPLREEMANTIEQHFMTMNNLDFDTLYGDLYGINYSANKFVLKLRAVYCTNEQSGDDEWTNDYSDDFIVEVPIEKNGVLNYEKATIVKHFYSGYTSNEPSSYEEYSCTYYYNPNVGDLYCYASREDYDGDVVNIFSINNNGYSGKWLELSGYTIENIISGAEFSIDDITISLPYEVLSGTCDIYAFTAKQVVKSTLADKDMFSSGTTGNITLKYNGQDIYIINTKKKLIRKLNFDTKTFKITL